MSQYRYATLPRRLPGLASPITQRLQTRVYSSATTSEPGSSPAAVPSPPARWISDLRSRVGKCIMFGCSPSQVLRAGVVLQALATEWRELLAGSEGYLTSKAGIDRQKVAWGEMDSFGHVNNVTYFRYAESARVNWMTHFACHVDPAHHKEWREAMTPRGTGLIMRSLKSDFKFPMVYPDTISVFHKLRSWPEADPAPSSFVLDCIVLSHQQQRAAAKLEEDIVIYDYNKAGKAAMPAFMRDVFDETYSLQQKEMARARQRIWALIEAVEGLENETWNKEDAVEDMGGASPAS